MIPLRLALRPLDSRSKRSRPRQWTRRRRRAALAAIALLVCAPLALLILSCGIFLGTGVIPFDPLPGVLPPLYPAYRRDEARLPQHHVKDPFAGGRKYLWVATHVSSSGWGNYMQDMIMNAYVACVSGRSYVWDEYTWSRDGFAYSHFGWKLIPSRIPLSAIISGPLAGGTVPDGDAMPLSVSREYWKQICPNPTRINAAEVVAMHGPKADGATIVETWRKYLAAIDDPCVKVERYSGFIFHVFKFGDKDEMLPVWPGLSKTPVVTHFGWSALAYGAFEANRGLFSPAPPMGPYVANASWCPQCVDPHAPLSGLLAVHIRRGDYVKHCANLGHWGAAFNAFVSMPELPDQWDPPHSTGEERMAVYMRRCLPTIEQVVEKVEAVRRSHQGQGLKNIYVMTNADREWLGRLKDALWKAHTWERIATSRDMVWTPEQKYVSQATDMLVGERAQVFIGNGFSSLSSGVTILRMAKGLHPNSTRMW